jgi:hypothetical protein
MMTESMPEIISVKIKAAKKEKNLMHQEHLMKAIRLLPTPKGSTTVVNYPSLEAKRVNEEEDEDDESGGMLEDPNDFYMRASRAMAPKSLPAPEILAPEEEDEE